MKKVLIIIGIALSIILVALTAIGFYALNASLELEHRGQNLEESYVYIRKAYPETVSWLDSVQSTGSLKDGAYTRNNGVNIHYFYASAPQPTGKTAILLHGYTDNAIRMLMIGKIFNHDFGYNIIIPDMPHAGMSDKGHISMGFYESQIALEMAGKAHVLYGNDSTEIEIAIHGISMGAATAMMAVADDEVNKKLNIKCAIEDCGYTSCWDEFSKEIHNEYGMPPFPLLYISDLECKLKYGWCFHDVSSLEAVKSSSIPMLFIHGDADTYVPTEMVNTLYNAKTKGDKELWLAPGSAHAESYLDHKEEYIQKVGDFVEKYMK